MSDWKSILRQVKEQITEIDVDEVAQSIRDQSALFLVDIREHEEVADGVIPGAITIPRGFLELRVEDAIPDKNAKVVVYCQGGVRSAFATRALRELGYSQAQSLAGGFNAWKRAGHNFDIERALTAEQRTRYGRHLLLPEVGEAGQLKLLDARVLMVGAGGLGSPAALYLAAAGVGTIGVIDMDVVDASNLQRQILHNINRVGEPKVDSARKTIEALNPDVRVIAINDRLHRDNVLGVFADFDIIVDGTDNFATRFMINDACVLLNKVNVHGSIFRFEGQATIFHPQKGPCYRCLYPEPPPPELAPSCAEAGVLGVLPGIVGSIQAVETIKVILDLGDPLIGRLITFDAKKMAFRELKLRKDPSCAICGENPTITELVDYEYFCSLPGAQ